MTAEQYKDALMAKGYTLARVAQVIGVSGPTVSLAIHKKGSARVLGEIERLLNGGTNGKPKAAPEAALPKKKQWTMSPAQKKKISETRKAQEAAKRQNGNGAVTHPTGVLVPNGVTTIKLPETFSRELAAALVGNAEINALITTVVENHVTKLTHERVRQLENEMKDFVSRVRQVAGDAPSAPINA